MELNIHAGLDPRDSHLDIAFMLGDASIPDDVSWPEEQRDTSCVWLDFEDLQFDICNQIKDSNPKSTIDDIESQNSNLTPTISQEELSIDSENDDSSIVCNQNTENNVLNIAPISENLVVPSPSNNLETIVPKNNAINKITVGNRRASITGVNMTVSASQSSSAVTVSRTMRQIRGCE